MRLVGAQALFDAAARLEEDVRRAGAAEEVVRAAVDAVFAAYDALHARRAPLAKAIDASHEAADLLFRAEMLAKPLVAPEQDRMKAESEDDDCQCRWCRIRRYAGHETAEALWRESAKLSEPFIAGFKVAAEEILAGAASDVQAKERDLYPDDQDARIEWDRGYDAACCAHRLGHDVPELARVGLYEPSTHTLACVVDELLDDPVRRARCRPDPRRPPTGSPCPSCSTGQPGSGCKRCQGTGRVPAWVPLDAPAAAVDVEVARIKGESEGLALAWAAAEHQAAEAEKAAAPGGEPRCAFCGDSEGDLVRGLAAYICRPCAQLAAATEEAEADQAPAPRCAICGAPPTFSDTLLGLLREQPGRPIAELAQVLYGSTSSAANGKVRALLAQLGRLGRATNPSHGRWEAAPLAPRSAAEVERDEARREAARRREGTGRALLADRETTTAPSAEKDGSDR